MDKYQARRYFQRAAPTYDEAAVVQRHMADELIDRLHVIKLAPQCILDVGCGTGYASQGLVAQYPDAQFIMLDFAQNMLQHARSFDVGRIDRICADAESMPIAPQSVDIIFCNATLHWCTLDLVLKEFLRVLKPEGLFTFSTFGPDTLAELRAAWKQVDADTHVHDFTDMHNVGDALVEYQFKDPVMDVDYLTVTHQNVRDALRDLKQVGANNAAKSRPRGLTGKGKYRELETAFEAFRNDQGLLESTFEIVYGHAWAPTQIVFDDMSGSVAIPLTQLRRS